ncbi:hypothetical protein QBC34DRAFT_341474 [Podospora aff. communis PSN243]|jgi:hypothetical protein|uniref:DUF7598 domain-containing protein n=1 Tax=Podospora aff. communis PSN243 TaxID=3040156 RepID=A0AAV9H4P2_9PEZI|nr:hypothetical protein QBC34DRAFT_341474 [Podospora aff. communis PSN243]
MFDFGANSKVRGSGHLVLNGLRALTLIGLGTVMVACWAMIVMSGITGHFQFFDTISHFFIFGISVFLVISEVNLFKAYFENNWPVLSPTHSLAWLGLALLIIGCSIMGDLVKPAYSQENLGLPIWRLVIASAILSIAFGVFNMIVSVIFRDGKNRITARMIRTDGNLAAPGYKNSPYDVGSYTTGYPTNDGYSQRSNSVRQKDEDEGGVLPSAARRFTRALNPKNMNFNFRKSRLQISAPMPLGGGHRDVEHGSADQLNDRASPIIPAVQRPPTALHPAFTGSSRYSEAHMTRFEEKI